jgi:hypothetical protein
MPDVCPISDLRVDECSHCTLAGPHDRADDSRPFAARYPGDCDGCGFDIKAGEHVQYQADRLVHVRCAHG